MKEFIAVIFSMDVSEVTILFIIAQSIGLVTTVVSLISAQMKKISLILAFELFINVLCALNYVLLDAISGGYICFLAAIQTGVSFVYNRRNTQIPKRVTAIFLILYVTISIVTYNQLVDILVYLCALAYALSVIQTKPSSYRAFIGLNTLLWIVYDIIVAAYTMIITHGLLLISILIAMIRQDLFTKKVTSEKTSAE